MAIVYVLVNEAMPGLVKIGMTEESDPATRVTQLYSTGVPFPFDVAYACRVDNADEVERALHVAFSPQRVNPRREFFRIEVGQAIAILRLLHSPDATQELVDSVKVDEESAQALQEARKRRPNLNFREMGIPVGSVLTAESDLNIRLLVTGDKKVRIGEQTEDLSLTAATQRVFGLENSVRPTPLWRYNGRLLNEIYEETYSLEQ